MSAQDPMASAPQDQDPQETREWLDALSAVIDSEGRDRAHQLLENVLDHARQAGIDMPFSANTAYVNTIPVEDQVRSPGNLEIEGRLRAYMRWNAMAMVVKANRHNPEDGGDLGGHIGSFASLAHIDALEQKWGASPDSRLLKAELAGMRANFLLTSHRSPGPFQMANWRTFRLPEQL